MNTPAPASPLPPASNQYSVLSAQSSQTSTHPLALIAALTQELARNRPGWQTTEFSLIALIVAALVILTAYGQIPPGYMATTVTFIGLGFGWLRSNRKDEREGSLLTLIDTISQAAPALAATMGSAKSQASPQGFAGSGEPGNGNTPATVADPALRAMATTDTSKAGFAVPDVLFALGVAVVLILVCALLGLFSGCAGQQPYYVSGIGAGVETGGNGQIDGGTVNITISPNPNVPGASTASVTAGGKTIVVPIKPKGTPTPAELLNDAKTILPPYAFAPLWRDKSAATGMPLRGRGVSAASILAREEKAKCAAVAPARVFRTCGASAPASGTDGAVPSKRVPSKRVLFAPDDDCLGAIIDFASSAKKTLLVADYSFVWPTLTDTLIALHRAGVDVELVLDQTEAATPGERPEIAKLAQAGVPYLIGRCKAGGIMHQKFLVRDGEDVECGSFNFTNTAQKENNFVLIETGVPEDAQKFSAEFGNIQAAMKAQAARPKKGAAK